MHISMLNYNAFTTQQLLMCISMMQMFEHAGVDSNKVTREQLQKAVDKRFRNNRVAMSPVRKAQALQRKTTVAEKPQSISKVCPECGSTNWYPGMDRFKGEITKYYWCKDCTYSEMVK